MSDQIRKAIGAHGLWKRRLKDAIQSGKSEFTVDGVAKDNNCEFGKWLHGTPELRNSAQHFESVKRLHAEFHKEVSKVLAKALAGKRADALKDLEVGCPFDVLSTRLVREMMDWSRQAA